MNKKILRQFEEQFGKEWECSCKTPFGVSSLEIISESSNSLLAHYVCPNCGKEQMLAASINSEKELLKEELTMILGSPLTSDDVLDIRQEVAKMKLGTVKNLYRARLKKTAQETVENLLPPASSNLNSNT